MYLTKFWYNVIEYFDNDLSYGEDWWIRVGVIILLFVILVLVIAGIIYKCLNKESEKYKVLEKSPKTAGVYIPKGNINDRYIP